MMLMQTSADKADISQFQISFHARTQFPLLKPSTWLLNQKKERHEVKAFETHLFSYVSKLRKVEVKRGKALSKRQVEGRSNMW